MKFITECVAIPDRFEKPFKVQKLYTFATETGKNRIENKDGKFVETCLVRDLFGSILYLSLQRKIDMAEVLTYPLTPVPLALSHVDGTMLKTEKSSITYSRNCHRRFVFSSRANKFTIFFWQRSKDITSKIMRSEGNIIHYITDKWIAPSIKDSERDSRCSTSTLYQIKGSDQK